MDFVFKSKTPFPEKICNVPKKLKFVRFSEISAIAITIRDIRRNSARKETVK